MKRFFGIVIEDFYGSFMAIYRSFVRTSQGFFCVKNRYCFVFRVFLLFIPNMRPVGSTAFSKTTSIDSPTPFHASIPSPPIYIANYLSTLLIHPPTLKFLSLLIHPFPSFQLSIFTPPFFSPFFFLLFFYLPINHPPPLPHI